jgi:hypothetical protein
MNEFKVKNGLIVDGDSTLRGGIYDISGSTGISGQFLSSTPNGVLWVSGNSATPSSYDYIDFNTGYTATAKTGRVYFDTTEDSLTFFPTTPNMDVALNIGQESLIRVFNNSGSQINNGSVVHISGSSLGLPTIVLSNAAFDDRAEVAGVATHNIPNNTIGYITNFGIVRDVNTSGFNVGDELYLSDTINGGFTNNVIDINFSSRVCSVGWVVTSGVTNGKILVSITNENKVQSLTNKQVNILLGNTVSTGVFEFTGLTKTSNTTFQIAPVRGWFVDNTTNPVIPYVLQVNYSGSTTGQTTPYLTTNDATYVLLTSASTITLQPTFPTPQERRLNIFLGKVIHPSRTSILNINNTVDFDVSPMSALRDLWTPIKLINDGIIVSPNGANLNINTSAGGLWGNGIGWTTNQLNPNQVSIAAKSPASFFYRTQTGGTSSSVTLIDPTKYDVGGAITSIGNANSDESTNQRVYLYPTGVINILYGQTKYTNLSAAVAGIQTETFVTYPNAQTTGVLIGIISVRNDIVADGQPLTNSNYAVFTSVSKFGELLGGTGGLSTTTLQQAYDNSVQPEITTNSILGAVTFKRGSASDSDNVLEIENGSGITNISLNASGRTTTKSLTISNLDSNIIDNRFLVVNNSGDTSYRSDIVLQSEFNSYTSNTQTEINLSNVYNTVLSPTLSMPTSVGGISLGTTVSQLSGLTFTSLFDDLLFPTVLPTYTIPTITTGGISNSTVEVGSTITPAITLSSIKNDGGNFTQLRILRNSSPIFTNTGLTVSWLSPVPDQFGFANPNTPNSGFTINPSPYNESYVIPDVGGGTTSTTSYRGDGDYNQGLVKKNNKNVNDIRGFLLRSTSAPQSGGTVSNGTQIDSSTITYTGIYPYFYGISATLPTPTTISHAISGGTATKVLSSAAGTLSIPYNTTGNYIWVAYFNNYTTKTKWYVNAVDNGNLDGSFLTSAVTQNVDSPNGFWSNITYKLHWSVNATSQSTLEYRNS